MSATPVILLMLLCFVYSSGCKRPLELQDAKWTPDSSVPTNAVCIRVVDTNGTPVAGAVVGTMLDCTSTNILDKGSVVEYLNGVPIQISDKVYGVFWLWSRQPPPVSHEDGMMTIPWALLVGQGEDNLPNNLQRVLYVAHPSKKIGGLCLVRPSAIGSRTILVLYPLCNVFGNVSDSDGKPLFEGQVLFLQSDLFLHEFTLKSVAGYQPVRENYETFLPPGKYIVMLTTGNGTKTEQSEIAIAPGQSAIQCNMRLR